MRGAGRSAADGGARLRPLAIGAVIVAAIFAGAGLARHRLRLSGRLHCAAIRRARHRLEHSWRLCGLREFRLGRASSPSASTPASSSTRPSSCRSSSPFRSRQPQRGLVGLGMGYLTLRLRGVFFSIATLALAVVLQTLVVNWEFVGGARGVYVLRPESMPVFGSYARYLFAVMLGLAIASVIIARIVENSWLGRGLAAIRDDEVAAVCCRRAVAAAETARDDDQRRADGGRRRAVPLFHHLCRSEHRLQPVHRGQHHRHAADRRHDHVARSGDRRVADRLAAAISRR